MARRAHRIEQIIAPAQDAGKFVLAGRFVSSTLAYQGTAGGLSAEEIMQVGRVAIDTHWPDVTVIFDVDEKTSSSRMGGSAIGIGQPSLFADRIEQRESEFHKRVRQGYLDLVATDPDHYLLIDASAGADEVFEALFGKLKGFLND